jgi:hypothetical protein
MSSCRKIGTVLYSGMGVSHLGFRLERSAKEWPRKALAINNIFEFSSIHEWLQKQGRNMAVRAIEYRKQEGVVVSLSEEAWQSRLEVLFTGKSDHEDTEDFSVESEAIILLAGSITTMSVYGCCSAVLGIYAHQLPLAVLVGLTWGSFRWNENELVSGLRAIYKEDMAAGRMYQKSRALFWKWFASLLSFYLLIYFPSL